MNVTIIGCGVYALGIANVLMEKNKITMWVHDELQINDLKLKMPNNKYEIDLNKSIENN